MPKPRLVSFQGNRYWFLPDDDDPDSGCLCPLSHCDKKGRLKMVFPVQDSFAHIYSGVIKRYGQVIGNVADFESEIEVN